MTTTRTFSTLGLATLATFATLASPLAVAQMMEAPAGWYAGLNAGRSRADIDNARITSGLQGAGFGTSGIADDGRSSGFKLYGGYRVNRNFALEGGYFDLGNFGYTATTVPAGTLSGNMKLRGLNLDLVGILPLTDRFEAFARVGAAYTQARDHFSGTGAVVVTDPNPSKSALNLKVGLGLGYNFSDNFGMRVEVERYRINDAVGNRGDIDLVSVGLVYRFGARGREVTPRTAAYVPPPAPVAAPPLMAAAPPPPPPPVVVTAAPVSVTFSADSLFDFDKAVVKPQGRQSLDRFVRDLQGTQYEAIAVTGHTDRLGPHDYNLRLSARRAEAVSAYLSGVGGIPAGKISAKGADGANPVTRPGDCVGSKPTPVLIACLQPDRRVDVEVSVTK
jgi:OOP family OmpA-OmpF porin